MTAPAPERLAELLAAVEMAEGPSRELDADLFIAFNSPGFVKVTTRLGTITTASPKYAKGAKDYMIAGETKLPLHYTSSVDAALALVERVLPGAGYTIINDPCGVHRKFSACVFFNAEDDFEDAKTAPLAILTALIRALITGAHHAD